MSKFPIFRHYLEDEDDKPYYTMNSLSFYYEDMERKQKLIESLAKSIAGYDIRLTDNLEAIEKEVDKRLADWDKQLERFPDSVEELLTKWSTDGTIDTVIQTALIDEKLEPFTVKLAETLNEISGLNANKLDNGALNNIENRIEHIVAHGGDGTKDTELLDSRVDVKGNISTTLKKRLDNKDYLDMLLTSRIEGTISTPVFNGNGTPQRIRHRQPITNAVIREDVFSYAGNIITETRSLSNGLGLIYKYNLSTFETEVISLIPEMHTNELEYARDTFAEWTLSGNAEVKNKSLTLYAPRDGYVRYVTNLKPLTKYNLLFTVDENTINGQTQIESNLTGVGLVLVGSMTKGIVKVTFVTQQVIANNYLQIRISGSATTGEINFKDLRIFETPPNSQIEADFESLSLEQLNTKYPWN